MGRARTVSVTGAGGFAGGHIAAGLAALGHAVVALDRHVDAMTRKRLAACRIVETDLDAPAARDAIADAEVVVHAAALTTEPAALGLSDAGHLRANLDALLAALDAAQGGRTAVFIFVSSSGVFAPGDAADRASEDTPARSVTPYGLAKRLGEAIVAASVGPRGFSVRLGYLYGPFETERPSRTRMSLVARWRRALERDEPIVVETPECRRDWTLVSDLAGAIDHLLDLPELPHPVLHMGSGEIVTDRDLAHLIAAGHPAARVIEHAEGAPAKAPMVSIRPALSGFAWTTLAQGLSRMERAA